MEAEVTAIESERLTLIPMTPAFLEACLAGDLIVAARLLDLSVPPEWLPERQLMKIRHCPAPWLSEGWRAHG